MRTIAEINEKIKQGRAVVVTAEEIVDLASKNSVGKIAKEVDVVTTGTFGPMCSSGAFLNVGHSKPKIKMQHVWLNGVPAYTGIAAVDMFIGAAELPETDPGNTMYPGLFNYGGGHVISELVAGKDLVLRATGYGTDCYPLKEIYTYVNIRDMNDTLLFNPRNVYQNYNVAVNTSSKTIYTYMGTLKPSLGNVNYSSAGQLSPLLNDPDLRTIGIGTRIFLGGGVGYVVWHGTQHTAKVDRTERNIPKEGAGTLAVMGDMKGMSPKWLVGLSLYGYGVSLAVGIGIPIPILDEEILYHTTVTNRDIVAPVVDYSKDYPEGNDRIIAVVNYQELMSGEVKIGGKVVPTGSMSSYFRANQIATLLKEWIHKGQFLLTEPAVTIGELTGNQGLKSLHLRPVHRVENGDVKM